MSSPHTTWWSSDFSPTFSGHETFALRSNWLKKACDLLLYTPDMFYRDDAFVMLGVGKNMAQSIRFWGRVCGVFTRSLSGDGHVITTLGRALLDDEGWDPFLVTPASRWLLHWQISSRPETAFTWFFVFNLLKGGEFTVAQLATQLQALAREHDWRVPSSTTLNRDIECMLNCYSRSAARQTTVAEDALLCPLTDLGLIQAVPGQRVYRLVSGNQADLPDALFAFAILEMMRGLRRQTLSFSELAYSPSSPGRVFRLDEDSLLSRLQQIRDVTEGQAYYSEQAGIRQIAWPNLDDENIGTLLLTNALTHEVRYV